MDQRIHDHPILKFDRGKQVNIYLNGEKLLALERETVAAALLASGIKVFRRSPKLGRPRGFFCGIGKCSSCLMKVNGIPNTRTCITKVADGMTVEYHDGKGDAPPLSSSNVSREKLETDVVVIGGGPAGLTAAMTAQDLGAEVCIIDENSTAGGQLIKQSHKFFGSKRSYAGVRGVDIAKSLLRDLAESRIEWLLDASVIGYYNGSQDTVAAVQNNTKLVEIHADSFVVAPGAMENMIPFRNNDLPGVYGAGGVQTIMNVFGVRPGSNCLMVGAGNVGLIVGYQLLQAGMNVEAVVEAAPEVGGYSVHAAKLARMGVPILLSHTIVEAVGRECVEGAVIAQVDAELRPIVGTERKLDVDFICLAVGLSPSSELLFQAGCENAYLPELGGYVAIHNSNLETTVDGVYLAGDVSGIEEASTAMIEGRIAGVEAASNVGCGGSRGERTEETSFRELEALRAGPFSRKVMAGKRKVYRLFEEME